MSCGSNKSNTIKGSSIKNKSSISVNSDMFSDFENFFDDVSNLEPFNRPSSCRGSDLNNCIRPEMIAYGGMFNELDETFTPNINPTPLNLDLSMPLKNMDFSAGALRTQIEGAYKLTYEAVLTFLDPELIQFFIDQQAIPFFVGVTYNNIVIPSSVSNSYSISFPNGPGIIVQNTTIARIPCNAILNLAAWAPNPDPLILKAGSRLIAELLSI